MTVLLLEVILANGLSRLLAVFGADWLLSRAFMRTGSALLAVAGGLLLAMPLTHLLPEAFEAPGADPHEIGFVMLVTVFVLVAAGRLSGTEHAHGAQKDRFTRDARAAAEVPALFCAVGLHNFVDGVLVATTFLVSESAGWLAAGAVLAHELASQVGYLVLLQAAGRSHREAVRFCLLLALPAVAGGVCGLIAIDLFEGLLPYALAMSAASFLFIALFALLPEAFEEAKGLRANLGRLGLVAAGIALSVLLVGIAHDHEHDGHAEEIHQHELLHH